MCAALQAATISPPGLLRRERQAGHGARSVRRTVELHADILTFLAAQLGLDLAADGDGSGRQVADAAPQVDAGTAVRASRGASSSALRRTPMASR